MLLLTFVIIILNSVVRLHLLLFLIFHSRNTCKSVLKLYKKLYLPSPSTNYRSQHLNGQFTNPRWNIAAEVEGSWIANNRSYIPRFLQKRLRASVLGRKFEVFDVSLFYNTICCCVPLGSSGNSPKIFIDYSLIPD